jgi:hypothetical protein
MTFDTLVGALQEITLPGLDPTRAIVVAFVNDSTLAFAAGWRVFDVSGGWVIKAQLSGEYAGREYADQVLIPWHSVLRMSQERDAP